MTCIVLHSTGARGRVLGAAKMSPPILKWLGIEKEHLKKPPENQPNKPKQTTKKKKATEIQHTLLEILFRNSISQGFIQCVQEEGEILPLLLLSTSAAWPVLPRFNLSVAVLGTNLEHWDNVLSSTLSLPYPLSFSIKNSSCVDFGIQKLLYKPFEMLDKSLIHIPTGLKT